MRSPLVQMSAAAGVPVPAVGVCEQAPAASSKEDASAVPTLVNTTSVVWLSPGASGLAVPPYLLIVLQV